MFSLPFSLLSDGRTAGSHDQAVCNLLKNCQRRTGTIPQWLKAMTVLPEVLGSILSAHMVDHNSLHQYSYGVNAFFSCADISKPNTHMHKLINKIIIITIIRIIELEGQRRGYDINLWPLCTEVYFWVSLFCLNFETSELITGDCQTHTCCA